jgi:hypothetical protein
MSTRAWRVGIVTATAIFVAGVWHYRARDENSPDQNASNVAARATAARRTAAEARPEPTLAASPRERARDQAPAPASPDDLAVAAFTIPVERALAGIGDAKPRLEVAVPAVPEFGQTLRQFAAEGVDPDWSAQTEARILGEISRATGLSASGVQVTCRTTLCRVLLTNPKTSEWNPRYRSFNDLVASFGLKTLYLWALPNENGTPIRLAYVQRDDAPAAQR